MNFLFFTPVSRVSAVGQMSSMVVRSLLASGYRVTVVATESSKHGAGPRHAFEATVLNWYDLTYDSAVFGDADHCVYQIGDNYEYHEGGLYWLQQRAGVICLHDFFLGNLFGAWAACHHEQACLVLKAWYGQEVADRYMQVGSTSFLETARRESPMTEWVCSMALGVVCHSEGGADRVLNSCPGPVWLVPLAWEEPNEPPELTAGNYAKELVEVAERARRSGPALGAIRNLAAINARWAAGAEIFIDAEALDRLSIFSS